MNEGMSNSKTVELRSRKAVPAKLEEKPENVENGASSYVKEEDKEQINDLVQKLPQMDRLFNVHKKIGEGTFSSVYLASLKQHSHLPDKQKRWFAIKHLVPTAHPARVEQELRCLREIGGKHNVIGVDLCFRNLDTIVFVMPYIPHRKFSELVSDISAGELRRYMRALLEALRHVHSFGVIHRDVKPSNFLYDQENQRFLLVDFGLAQRIAPAPLPPPPPAQACNARVCVQRAPLAERDHSHTRHYAERAGDKRHREPDGTPPQAKRAALEVSNTDKQKLEPNSPKPLTPLNNKRACTCWGLGGVCGVCAGRGGARAARAGTTGYRPPEVLLRVAAQGPAVDVWAAGVVLAAALVSRHPLLRAAGDAAALAELASLLGDQPLNRAAHKLGRRIILSTPRRGICLRKLSCRLRGAAITCRAPSPAPAPTPPDTRTHARAHAHTRNTHTLTDMLDAHARSPHTHNNTQPLCKYCRLQADMCLCLDPNRPAHEWSPAVRVGRFPDAAFGLAARLLDPDPRSRPSAADALAHPYFTLPDPTDNNA